MSVITGVTRGGVEWTPAFIVTLNQQKCIGCGRCYKVCPRSVFELIDRDDLDLDEDLDSDDEFDDEAPGMVMNLKDRARLHRLRGLLARLSQGLSVARAAGDRGLIVHGRLATGNHRDAGRRFFI